MLLSINMSIISEYLNVIHKKLSSNFDFSENYSIDTLNFDFLASFNAVNTKFAVLKEIKIYGFETNEYFLLKTGQPQTKESLLNEIDIIKAHIRDIAQPHSEHMSSQILLVHIFEEEIPEEVAKIARRTKYQKGFAFGFKGWADLGLVVISLKSNRVVTHKKFIKTASFFTPEKTV